MLYNHLMKERALIVDDDPELLGILKKYLENHGLEAITAANGAEALAAAPAGKPDIIITDVEMPRMDGFTLCRRIKENKVTADIPVIIMTGKKVSEADHVSGYTLGADDYVVKPFSVMELLARIEAVLRRSPSRPEASLQIPVPGGVLDLGKRELQFQEGTTPLSEREAELLTYLVQNRNRAVSRDEILARVWHMNPDAVETRTVDMHIARLREKLRDDSGQPRVILTMRGRGYQFASGEPQP